MNSAVPNKLLTWSAPNAVYRMRSQSTYAPPFRNGARPETYRQSLWKRLDRVVTSSGSPPNVRPEMRKGTRRLTPDAGLGRFIKGRVAVIRVDCQQCQGRSIRLMELPPLLFHVPKLYPDRIYSESENPRLS